MYYMHDWYNGGGCGGWDAAGRGWEDRAGEEESRATLVDSWSI